MGLQTDCKHFRWTAPRRGPHGGPEPEGAAAGPDDGMSLGRDWGARATAVWWRRYRIAFDRERADPPRIAVFGGVAAVAETFQVRPAARAEQGPHVRLANAFAAFFGEDVAGEEDPGSRSAEGGPVCPVPYCAKGRFSVRRMRALRSVDRLCDDCPVYGPRSND